MRADPVGALVRADDPLAGRDSVKPADLADRRWFLFPEGTDPWQSYWNGTVGMTLLNHQQADGLVVVPLIDMPPSRVVVAWNEGDTNPLVRSFLRIAIAAYRDGAPTDPS